MRKRQTRLITEAQQSFSFTRRALFLGGAQAAIGAVLIGRMGWLAIAENDHYQMLSESNRVNLTLVPPRRGWIIDRNGVPIANNRTDFRVDLIPDRLVNIDRTLDVLAQILSLDADEVRRIRDDIDKAAGFQPVAVAENLDYQRYAAVGLRLPDLPGVAPTRGFSRNYPAGAAVAHLTGYVGMANAEQYQQTRDPLMITPGFKLGKDGLEKTLEPLLRGKPGAKRVEVTARGKLVRELETRPDVSGRTVRLSIDAGLQSYAARRLGDASGSVIVIDTHTGGILAMVSMPAYDPNSFSDGISHDEWDMLSTSDHLPLLNKTLQALYPPGSTVKPMNSLALLAAGVNPATRVNCTGRYRVGNGYFHCHKRRGHGAIDMKGAVAQSCDIYFYAMAREYGYDRIAAMAKLLGMGERFNLPVASQRFGTVPDAAWKQKKYNKDWTVADTVNASIGQGYMLANPLQLAVMAARIASGRALQPTLIANRKPVGAPLPIPPEHLAIVRESMSAVINGGGTGGRARLNIEGVELAGKTGTAQVRRITMAERRTGVLGDSALPFKLRDHSLFMGFAPLNQPRYAVSCVLEHSGHIVTAAPIASDVLSFLFDREKAMKKLEALEADWGGDIQRRMATQAAAWKAAKSPPAVPTAAAPADSAAAPANLTSEAAPE